MSTPVEYPCSSTLCVPLHAVPVPARPPSACAAVRRAARPTSAVGITRVYTCVCIPICIRVRIYMRAMHYAHRPRVLRSTCAVSARARAGARAARVGAAAARRRRTGRECGAQQPVARPAGADRVGVEVRIAADAGGEVAAPRGFRVGLHEGRPRGLARGSGGGAARRLGLDPHGARRAHVAVRGTGHVRACARQHRMHRPWAVPQRPRTPVPERYRGSTREYPPSAPPLPTARQRRGVPSSTPKCMWSTLSSTGGSLPPAPYRPRRSLRRAVRAECGGRECVRQRTRRAGGAPRTHERGPHAGTAGYWPVRAHCRSTLHYRIGTAVGAHRMLQCRTPSARAFLS
jgi:hypothetical protein